MNRKLASIQRITRIEKIPGCSFIELATIQGWHCVVKRDEFKVGDNVVYFEIGSQLPNESWSAQFASSDFKVKTKRVRNAVSQGAAMHIGNFKSDLIYYGECDDLTDVLGVKECVRYPRNDVQHLQSDLSILSKPAKFEVVELIDDIDSDDLPIINHYVIGEIDASAFEDITTMICDRFVADAKGDSKLRDGPRCGLLFRSFDRSTQFKVMNQDYLLLNDA